MDINISSPQLFNKVGRGTFQFFFLQRMKALDANFVRLSDEPVQRPKASEAGIKTIAARLRATLKK
ncbi:MAG: hypothetical protein IPI09_04235 [Burkholderiales bacterium]|nr:hypothetical protein [Burkholderiales bacterium]MBK7280011.1 hypothetical protein [Burkholderiales bacterium]